MFDKDDEEISKIIEAGLEEILSGRATLEQFLTAHPEQASQVRPELEAAMWLQARREQVAPRPGFVTSSRKRVLARIKQEATNTGAKRAFFGFIWPQKLAYQWVAVVLALIIFFSGTGGLVSAAQGALPGDGLYAIKRISEKLVYTLASNELQRLKLSAEYTNRRLDEISSLLGEDKIDKAGEVIPEFESQVRETVSLLQNADNGSLLQKRSLAHNLEQDFSRQSTELTQLQASSPEQVSKQLEHARVLVDMSASVAGSVAGGIKGPNATGTFTPTASGTPTGTASPTPTMTVTVTPTPTGTLFPALDQPNSAENGSSVTGGEDGTNNGLHLGQTPKPERTLPSSDNSNTGGGTKNDPGGGKDKPDNSGKNK